MARVLALSLLFALSACPPTSGEDGSDAGRRKDASTTAHEDAGVTRTDGGPAVGVDAGSPDGGDTAGLDAASSVWDAGGAASIDTFWANTQWPPFMTLGPGEKAKAYGQVWIPGGTDPVGAMSGMSAELGQGPLGSDPTTWTWTAAAFNADRSNKDEFFADVTAPASGVHEYAFRYRVAGSVWKGVGAVLYAGLAGPTLAAGEAAKLAVRVAGGRVKVATQNLHCKNDDATARLDAIAARYAVLQLDFAVLQEVCEDSTAPAGNSADYLAKALATSTGRPWRYLWVQTHLANSVTPEGVGLITALPIAATTTLDLPTGDFTRKALLGVVASPAGMLAAVATHLDYLPADDAVRQQQASAILDLVHTWQTAADKPGGTSALVAGDFNTTPGTAPLTTFTSATPPFVDAWDAKMPGVPGYSYPSSAPTERIDFLLVRGPPGGTLDVVAVSHEFMLPYSGTSYVSDHTGFAATLGVP